MAQEFQDTVMLLAAYKNLWLAIAGYVVKVFWSWSEKPSWPKLLAGLIFCVAVYNLVDNYVNEQWRGGLLFACGMLAGNIINGIFKWAKVNEEELMDRTRRWWNSDKHKTT